MPIEVMLYRMVVAAAFGFIIGYERERHGRPAGLKTQMIVAASACLLMIVSLELETLHVDLDSTSVVRLDPGRIASYAVAGMGFLGAGAIIQGKSSVQGLTTAALLWAGNAIGLAVGAGFILPATVAVLGIVFSLFVLTPIAEQISKDIYYRIFLEFDGCWDRAAEIRGVLKDYHVKQLYTGFDCQYDAGRSTYEVAVRLKSTTPLEPIAAAFRKLEGLTGIRWAEGHVP